MACLALGKAAAIFLGLQQQRRHRRWTTVIAKGDIDEVGAVGMHALAGQQMFGLYAQLYLDAGATDPGDASMDQHQPAQQDRLQKGDTIDRDRDGRPSGVAHSFRMTPPWTLPKLLECSGCMNIVIVSADSFGERGARGFSRVLKVVSPRCITGSRNVHRLPGGAGRCVPR